MMQRSRTQQPPFPQWDGPIYPKWDGPIDPIIEQPPLP